MQALNRLKAMRPNGGASGEPLLLLLLPVAVVLLLRVLEWLNTADCGG